MRYKLGRSRPARRRARQRRQRDLAQGQRRHLSPAAALRAAAARPRHDAAQVRPPALVPDQPRRRDPARSSGSSSRRRGVLQLHGPDDLRPVGQRQRRSVTGAEHRRCLPTSIVDAHDGRADVHRSPDQAGDSGAPTASRSCCGAQSKTGVFGWISYTLSRSERLRDSHVGRRTTSIARTCSTSWRGLPLRRNWDIGVRVPVPERRARDDHRRLQRRAQRRLRAVRPARRQARRLAHVAARLLRRHHERRAAARRRSRRARVIRYVLPTVGLRGRL